MQITTHFSRADLERSEVALRNDIPNRIPDSQLESWKLGTARLLEPIILRAPDIMVNSAYRSPLLNRRIGGSSNSQHTGSCWARHADPPRHVDCVAFDLELPDRVGGNGLLWRIIASLALPFDQLIWEFGDDDHPDWIHIGHITTPNVPNRQQPLRSLRVTHAGSRRVIYQPLELAALPVAKLSDMISDTPPFHPDRTYTGGSKHADES